MVASWPQMDRHRDHPTGSTATAVHPCAQRTGPRSRPTTWAAGEDLVLVHATGFCAGVWLPLIGCADGATACRPRRAAATVARPSPQWGWTGGAPQQDVLATIDALGLETTLRGGPFDGGRHPWSWPSRPARDLRGLWLYEPIIFPPELGVGTGERPTRWPKVHVDVETDFDSAAAGDRQLRVASRRCAELSPIGPVRLRRARVRAPLGRVGDAPVPTRDRGGDVPHGLPTRCLRPPGRGELPGHGRSWTIDPPGPARG